MRGCCILIRMLIQTNKRSCRRFSWDIGWRRAWVGVRARYVGTMERLCARWEAAGEALWNVVFLRDGMLFALRYAR